MKYRDLKDQRDAAVARAIEAERLSMKSEFDRITEEFMLEKAALLTSSDAETRAAYRRGFSDGLDALAKDVSSRLSYRTALLPRTVNAEGATTIIFLEDQEKETKP